MWTSRGAISRFARNDSEEPSEITACLLVTGFQYSAVTISTVLEAIMANKVQAVPKGYHTVTPSLVVAGAAKAIDFYKRALEPRKSCGFPDRMGP